MLKFKKNGSVKAVLRDDASEPDGIVYLEGPELPEGIEISTESGVLSLEELDELEKAEGEIE